MLNFLKKACHFIFVCYAPKGIEKNWGKIQKVRKLRATVFLRDTSVEMFLLVRSYLRQSRAIVHTIIAMAKKSIDFLIDALHFNGKTKSANTNNNSLIQGKSSCNFHPNEITNINAMALWQLMHFGIRIPDVLSFVTFCFQYTFCL